MIRWSTKNCDISILLSASFWDLTEVLLSITEFAPATRKDGLDLWRLALDLSLLNIAVEIGCFGWLDFNLLRLDVQTNFYEFTIVFEHLLCFFRCLQRAVNLVLFEFHILLAAVASTQCSVEVTLGYLLKYLDPVFPLSWTNAYPVLHLTLLKRLLLLLSRGWLYAFFIWNLISMKPFSGAHPHLRAALSSLKLVFFLWWTLLESLYPFFEWRRDMQHNLLASCIAVVIKLGQIEKLNIDTSHLTIWSPPILSKLDRLNRERGLWKSDLLHTSLVTSYWILLR